MTLFSQLRSWFRSTFRRSRLERDMDAELRFHLETYADDLIRSGVPRDEALRLAQLEFGSLEHAKEESATPAASLSLNPSSRISASPSAPSANHPASLPSPSSLWPSASAPTPPSLA